MFKKILLASLFFISIHVFSISIDNYKYVGQNSLIRQNYFVAIENFKEAVRLNNQDVTANKGLSDSFFMIGEYEESLRYIDICIELNQYDLNLKNKKARILTALERYNEAQDIYSSVIDKEIYNVGAKSGLAELRIVTGDLKGSLYDFEKILEFSPNSRRLLLSLVVLYDKQNNRVEADRLIQKAIRIYPQDPIVLESAVKHYIKSKNYSGANIYMNELSALSDNEDIKLLQAKLYIYLEEYDSAISVLTEYMKVVKNNPESYYISAVVLDHLGREESALSLLKRGLSIKPDMEIYRLYAEDIMDELYTLKDDKRELYSMWYLNNGKMLEDQFYYEKAKTYYLRGLDLDPFSIDLRTSYADILNRMGYKQKYLKELGVVLDQESENKDIKDTIMIEKSLPKLDIYQKWGEESFKNEFSFTLSIYVDSSAGEYNLESAKVIQSVARRFLGGESRYKNNDVIVYNGDYSNAYRSARESGSDFFIVLSFLEGSRTFSLKSTIYLTKSGREIGSFSYLKTGNNRIFNCFETFSKDLNSFMPLVGTVNGISGKNILIDIGRENGVVDEMVFDVVKKGGLVLIPDKPLLSYTPDDFLGKLEIESIGEGISSGLFTGASNFNLLNIGDQVLLLNDDAISNAESDKSIVDRELIQQLLQVN
ncbi:MAG: hypothetical protein B6229_08295 [Spirochaetaceae bacterium 4572_7]|nr:MAG: hypothetical protein B6229_08295 [Spirochaetaceae bacterium 4572_7]